MITAAVMAAAGLVMALGLTTPAGAVVASVANTPPAPTATPDTLASSGCLTGENNSYEFYTWCKGTSPTSFRTIAYCADSDAVLGVEYADGSGNLSYADCSSTGGLDSTLGTGTNADWGILLCSNYNGTGTYQGYIDRSGDISWILGLWGSGNITDGGNTLCEYSISVPAAINPLDPLTS